jgi:thymidylate kinase
VHIAEIIGLPGAGKTTVVSLVASRVAVAILRHPSVEIQGRGVIGRLLMTAKCPLASAYFYGFVCFRRRLRLQHVLNVFSLQKRFVAVYCRSGGSSLLVDEGVVHGMFSAAFGSSSTAISRFFLRRIVRSLVRKEARFYFLDVDKETSAQRFLGRRSNSRFSADMTEENRDTFFDDDPYQELITVIRTVAPEKLVERSSLESMVEVLVTELGTK